MMRGKLTEPPFGAPVFTCPVAVSAAPKRLICARARLS